MNCEIFELKYSEAFEDEHGTVNTEQWILYIITLCHPQLLVFFPNNSTESIVYQFTIQYERWKMWCFHEIIENPFALNPFALFDFWILHINQMATVWISIFIFPDHNPHEGWVITKLFTVWSIQQQFETSEREKNLIIQNTIAYFTMKTVKVSSTGLRYHLVSVDHISLLYSIPRTFIDAVFNRMNKEQMNITSVRIEIWHMFATLILFYSLHSMMLCPS